MRKSVVFIIVAMLAVVGVYVYQYLDAPVETKIALYTEYEESFDGDALFIRGENVYSVPNSGTFYSLTDEGARVGRNRVIAALYDGVVDSSVLWELHNIDIKMESLEEIGKYDIFIVDASGEENYLKNLKNEIISAAMSNNPSDVTKAKNNIKSVVLGEENLDIKTRLEGLKRRKNELENQLSGKKNIISDRSGIYSTNIDGLEGLFNPDEITKYTVSDFDSAPEPKENSLKTFIGEGEQVCKVIDNHVWKIMVKTKLEKTDGYKKGETVVLRFDSIPGVEAKCKVLGISEPEDDEVLIFLECEEYVEGIFSIRKSSVEVIKEQYRGFEIPIYAVRVKDGQEGVMVQYGVNEVFKPCEVVFTDKENDTVIIKSITEGVINPLSEYDRIVIGENVSEEKGSE